jgi:hypothetical protein
MLVVFLDVAALAAQRHLEFFLVRVRDAGLFLGATGKCKQ